MRQAGIKGNKKGLNWAVPHLEPNKKQKNVPPQKKFTYSGRICRFAQFFILDFIVKSICIYKIYINKICIYKIYHFPPQLTFSF